MGCWLELVELLLAYHVVNSDPKRIDVSSMVLNHDSSGTFRLRYIDT